MNNSLFNSTNQNINLDKLFQQHNYEKNQLFSQYNTERDRIQNLYFVQIEGLKNQLVQHIQHTNIHYNTSLTKLNEQHNLQIKEFIKKK